MNDSCCIENILNIIVILQENASKIDDIPSSCDKPFLGVTTGNNFVFNTRPITFYNANNELITLPYTLINDNTTIEGESSVFRVEKVEGCAITCRVLALNPDTTPNVAYVATDNFFTISSNCICALRCLPDTFINCI